MPEDEPYLQRVGLAYWSCRSAVTGGFFIGVPAQERWYRGYPCENMGRSSSLGDGRFAFFAQGLAVRQGTELVQNRPQAGSPATVESIRRVSAIAACHFCRMFGGKSWNEDEC